MASAKNIVPANLTIPTLPTVVTKIGHLLEDPESGVKDFAEIIAGDAPLAARVLKIANSAYYGLRERCLSTQQAATVLGVRVLRNVVMQASVIGQHRDLEALGFDLEGLWKHSVLTAQSCHFLARRCKRTLNLSPDEMYVCGLLHDLGQIVLLDNLKAAYLPIAARSNAEGLPIQVVEREVLGFDHTDVGHIVALRWGLPPQVADAIQFHHANDDALGSDATVVLVAKTNVLVHRVCEGNVSGAGEAFDPRSAQALGLSAADIGEVIEFAQRTLPTVVI